MLNQHTLTQMVLDGIVVFAGDWPAKRSSQRWSDLWLLVVRVHPVTSDTATLCTSMPDDAWARQAGRLWSCRLGVVRLARS